MKEDISALVDGELSDLERQRVLSAMGQDEQLRRVWERYHVAGTVLRRELDVMVGPDLADRIHQRLQQETPGAPGWKGWLGSRQFLKIGAGVAIAASVATVAILSLPPVLTTPAAAPLARQTGTSGTIVAETRPTPPEQQRALNPYLVRHGEFSPAGMNGMLGYVRVVGGGPVSADSNSASGE